MKNLEELFQHQIKDLYSAEKQLLEAMPKMEKAAHSQELIDAFQKHYKETQEQFKNLQMLCDKHNINPTSTKCKAMEGLIEEGEHFLKEDADKDVKDAGIIASAQRIEHYEISAYGTARQYAEALGHKEAEKVLKSILEQEQKTDTDLNKLAINSINRKAMN